MCGRYTLTASHRPELLALGLQTQDRYNIAPHTEVLILDESENHRLMTWEYSPAWAREPMHLTNARSETLREKPSFRGAKRCVFIADGWYEWQRTGAGSGSLRGPARESADGAAHGGTKVPWYHHRQGELLYFAGIYNIASGCAIVTREAHHNIAHVHHRQPVLLDARAVPHWLEGHDLFASAITRSVQCHPVSAAVNKPTNDNPGLIVELPQPVGEGPASDSPSATSPGETPDFFE